MSSTEAPVSRLSQKTLPLPVIHRIFVSFNAPCYRHPHDKCRRLSCRDSSPLLLGKVCREWREIAWKLPTLWQWIDIQVLHKLSDIQLQLVDEWLHRAADEPLIIVARPERSRAMQVYGQPWPQRTELFKLIVNYSMHWKILDVISDDGDMAEILNAARGRTAILESVFIQINSVLHQGSSLKFLEDAPNLRSLYCVGVRNIEANTNPWKNLVTLSSASSSNTILPFLLSHAPNLQHLRVETTSSGSLNPESAVTRPTTTNSGNSQQTSSDEVFTLPPYLISLIITGWETPQFIRRLEAPSSLQRLSIIHKGKDRTLAKFSLTPIINLIDRAKCNLRSFGISTVIPIDVESLHNLLPKLNSVTRLYVDSKDASSYRAMMHQIPQMLDPTPDPSLPISTSSSNNVMIPSLQVLYYSIIDSGMKSQHIIDMIKHRCKGQDVDLKITEINPGQFAKLKIVRFNKTNPKVLLDSLQEEIAEGLEITYDLPYKGEPFE